MLSALIMRCAERLGLPGRSAWRAAIALIVVLVIVPLLATAGLAWIGQVVGRNGPFGPSFLTLSQGPSNGQSCWTADVEMGFGCTIIEAVVAPATGSERLRNIPGWSVAATTPEVNVQDGAGVVEVALGWPFRAVVARCSSATRADGQSIVLSEPGRGATAVGLDLDVINGLPFLPGRVIWRGLVGDFAAYTAVVLGCLLLRSRLRRRGDGRSRCAKCGYVLAGLRPGSRCPECGSDPKPPSA